MPSCSCLHYLCKHKSLIFVIIIIVFFSILCLPKIFVNFTDHIVCMYVGKKMIITLYPWIFPFCVSTGGGCHSTSSWLEDTDFICMFWGATEGAVNTHTHTDTDTHTHTHTHTRAHTHTHTHTHRHTRAHTHAHTHTQFMILNRATNKSDVHVSTVNGMSLTQWENHLLHRLSASYKGQISDDISLWHNGQWLNWRKEV